MKFSKFKLDKFVLDEFQWTAEAGPELLSTLQEFSTNPKIAAHTGVPERSLHYYLQQLIELGYVARKYPLTGGKSIARKVRYVLEDPLLRFWFRFVFPNLSFIQQMGPRRTLREIVRPQLDSFFGYCFENLCREALPRLYEREGISAAFSIGEYWDKGVQIDVVGLRDDNWTDLGECKLTPPPRACIGIPWKIYTSDA